ncbi:FtsX-like permease family protein [Georgenia yuyongxinii]
MRPLEVLREATRTVLAQRVSALLIALLTAAMCLTTLATVGRTAAAEAQVQARLEGAGSRVLRVTDVSANGLLPDSLIDAVGQLSTVERAVGTSLPEDVVNGAIGDGGVPVPAWEVNGELADIAELRWGRWAAPGEALVAEDAMTTLGFEAPVGYLDTPTGEVSIVGSYRSRAPFEFDGGALIPSVRDDARTIHVVATGPDAIASTQRVVLGMVAAPSAADIRVESPETLAILQAQVGADLGGFSRVLLIAVVGIGAALTAVVVLADTLVRRKDLGRRRALGATRTSVVVLVVLRTAIPAIGGAIAGTAAGVALGVRWSASPPWDFVAGTAVLAVFAATSASLVPAIMAATRDAVAVLRTP